MSIAYACAPVRIDDEPEPEYNPSADEEDKEGSDDAEEQSMEGSDVRLATNSLNCKCIYTDTTLITCVQKPLRGGRRSASKAVRPRGSSAAYQDALGGADTIIADWHARLTSTFVFICYLYTHIETFELPFL